MKQKHIVLAVIITLMLPGIIQAQNTFPSNGSAGIGTVTPDASSILEIKSTTQGMLIPRMTLVQRNAILLPATGLMIYQTTNAPGFYYYDGSSWKQMTPAGVNRSLSNLISPTAVNVDLVPGNDVVNLGSPDIFWRTVYLNNIRFKDGSLQTSAFTPYAAGTGISIVGNLISNTGDTSGADDANLSLANLAATSINQSLVPNADNSKDLGSASSAWKDIYTKGSIYFSGNKVISFAGTENTFVGVGVGGVNTGTGNSFFGKSAGQSNITGGHNAFFGQLAGQANTAGSYNSFFGQNAGSLNTNAFYNSFFGNAAGQNNTTGSMNSFFGQSAGPSTTTGSMNTFVGKGAGFSNTTGSSNLFFGKDAGSENIDGKENLFFGNSAGAGNTGGDSNSVVGSYALYNLSTGNNNTAFGHHALYSNTYTSENTAIGNDALYHNTTAESTALGYASLYANTVGQSNTGLGFETLHDNTTGDLNTAVGYLSLYASNGDNNTGLGYGTLFFNSTGNNNTAGGLNAMSNNTTGSQNTAFGKDAGGSAKTNNYCSFFGYNAGQAVNTNYSNSMALGNGSRITASNQARIGNSSVTSIGGYADWSNISDGRFKKNLKQNVPGLAFINKLKPITYNLDITSLRNFLGEDVSHDKDGQEKFSEVDEKTKQQIQKKEAMIQTGFVAQDVEKAAKELGYDFSGVDKPENENSPYGLRYSEFVVPLVKAVQELDEMHNSLSAEQAGKFKSQNDAILALQKENDELKERLAKIEALLNNQQVINNQATSNIKLETSNASLEQNRPNPFNHTTTINYTLPSQFTSAQIIITDQVGKTIKAVSLSNLKGTGKGALTLDASSLASGTYIYSLHVNGSLIGSRQMVLTK